MIKGAIMVPHPPLIIPEVGRGEEHIIDETAAAYDKAARFVAKLEPETIVIASPHSIMYRDYLHISPGERAEGDLGSFRAPNVRIEAEYDTEMVRMICKEAEIEGLSAGTDGERAPALDHGTLIPLYFINKYLKKYKVIRIGLSMLTFADHYRLGKIVQQVSDSLGRSVVFVGSGDLSHKLQHYGPYGFAKEGPEYDRRIMEVCGKADFQKLLEFDEDFCEKAAECGHRSFVMMAGALDGLKVDAEMLSHQDVTGVGYGICTYRVLSPEDRYVDLARKTIKEYILNRHRMDVPDDLPEEMLKSRAGTFVSLHREGALRGCIGTIAPTRESIAEEIISNAISAATRDPRFDPLQKDEIEDLEISVDVLMPAERIDSVDLLDVKRYGVIVTKGFRRGLLLPDLEGVDSSDKQVRIALLKAGLSPDEKDFILERFEVIRHK